MIKKRVAMVVSVVCALAVAVCVLSACTSQTQTAEEKAQEENRTYMASMNKIATELEAQLTELSAAILSGDKVTISSKATDALSILDKINSMEVPDALADVHEHYKAGATSLREALQGYVDLFAGAADTSSSAFTSALASIQEAYNTGIAELKAADEAAAAKS